MEERVAQLTELVTRQAAMLEQLAQRKNIQGQAQDQQQEQNNGMNGGNQQNGSQKQAVPGIKLQQQPLVFKRDRLAQSWLYRLARTETISVRNRSS